MKGRMKNVMKEPRKIKIHRFGINGGEADFLIQWVSFTIMAPNACALNEEETVAERVSGAPPSLDITTQQPILVHFPGQI